MLCGAAASRWVHCASGLARALLTMGWSVSLTVPTISVVIPAFQAEAYFSERDARQRACGVSTLRTSRSSVVNDGSTDGTEDLVLRAAARDPRITLLQGSKRGPGCARAVALPRRIAWALRVLPRCGRHRERSQWFAPIDGTARAR